MKVKQAIVLRRRYSDGEGGVKTISWGKAAAQVAHASMWWLADRFQKSASRANCYTVGLSIPESEWLESGEFAKICLQVDTAEELHLLTLQAQEAGLLTHTVVDHGHTEFGGVHTTTCLAIGPGDADEIDKITGHLKLL